MSPSAPAAEEVLVAGAGPVGMSAALALRARGVPVTVLEAEEEGRDRPGSRANYVHGATLRTLEAVHPGLGHRIADEGIVWPTRRTFWRGREVFSRTYPQAGGGDELPPFTSLTQVAVEAFMQDAIDERGIEIRWETAVESVESGPDGVRVVTDDGEEFETPYLVGADGAGSTVRKEIGSEFVGDQSEITFIIADVAEVEDDPLPLERTFHYGHPGVDGRNVLLVPFAGGWRVDITSRPSDDPDRLSSDPFLSELIAATVGERYTDRVTWVSTYQFKQVTADRFVDDARRVLLAGEAGHLFAPFGARGMNSGIADADLAASAIAVALRCESGAVARAEVEDFAATRETAAEWNRDAAGEALEHLRGAGLDRRVKTRAAAMVAPWWEPAGEWLDSAPFGPRSGPPIPTSGKY